MGSELTVGILRSQVAMVTSSSSASFMTSDYGITEDEESVYYAVRLPLIVVDEGSRFVCGLGRGDDEQTSD